MKRSTEGAIDLMYSILVRSHVPAIRYLNCVATPYVDVLYTILCAGGGGGGGGGERKSFCIT